MKKIFPLLFLLLTTWLVSAQNVVTNTEQFPVFPACKNLIYQELESCFYNQVQDFVYNHFQVPEDLKTANYTGSIIVLFEVNQEGVFKTIYIDTNDDRLLQEAKKVFEQMPKIDPATYNGKPTYAKYTLKIAIPLKSAADIAQEQEQIRIAESKNYTLNQDKELNE